MTKIPHWTVADTRERAIAAELDLGKRGDDFWVYALGIFACSVCSSLTPEETERLLRERTGGSWTLSADEAFADGHPNPFQCPDSEAHKHYLFE